MDLGSFLKKQGLKEGNLVEVQKGQCLLKGTIVPSKDSEMLVLKLDSGYNVGLKVSEVKEIKKVGEGKSVRKASVILPKANSQLPKISLIHTGGTIAARVDYERGAVSWHTTPKDLLSMYPELFQVCNPKATLLKSMATEDFRFKHFALIAKAIEKEIGLGADGIILSMGTDNLAVASAALVFIFESISVPVIIVGSQRSSDRGSSDAFMNLMCAANFIAKSDFAGIAICMHDSNADDYCAILPACKTKKLHTSRRDAFKPVNDKAIAKVNFKTKEIEFIKKDYLKRDKKRKIVAKPNMEEKKGFLKASINMQPEQLDSFKKMGYKGLIIEGTGLGHMPLDTTDEITAVHKKIKKTLQSLIDSGCVVVMTSTCLFGRVQMHVYSKQVELSEMGVLSGEDMLPETAFVKLAWLLGNYKPEEAKKLIPKNLRGEITERTEINEFEWD